MLASLGAVHLQHLVTPSQQAKGANSSSLSSAAFRSHRGPRSLGKARRPARSGETVLVKAAVDALAYLGLDFGTSGARGIAINGENELGFGLLCSTVNSVLLISNLAINFIPAFWRRFGRCPCRCEELLWPESGERLGICVGQV